MVRSASGRAVPVRLVVDVAMVAQDVGADGALGPVSARGAVEGHLVGLGEQGGEPVDEGGLAGADLSGEQAVAAVEDEALDGAVEGAPVEHLELVEADAGAAGELEGEHALIGCEVAGGGHAGAPSLAGLASAASSVWSASSASGSGAVVVWVERSCWPYSAIQSAVTIALMMRRAS